MTRTQRNLRSFGSGILLVLLVGMCVNLSGCKAPGGPDARVPDGNGGWKCLTVKCKMKQARAKYRKDCINGFQNAARKRPFKVIYPYDDPQWQHEYCGKKAKRMVR